MEAHPKQHSYFAKKKTTKDFLKLWFLGFRWLPGQLYLAFSEVHFPANLFEKSFLENNSKSKKKCLFPVFKYQNFLILELFRKDLCGGASQATFLFCEKTTKDFLKLWLLGFRWPPAQLYLAFSEVHFPANLSKSRFWKNNSNSTQKVFISLV